MTTSQEYAWAEGLLEGEAYFGLYEPTQYPRIKVEMTDLDVLERLQSIFGGNINPTKKRNPKWKDTWNWTLNGDEAVKCLRSIVNNMCSRRKEKISWILDQYDERVERLKEAENRELNIVKDRESGLSLRQLAEKYSMHPEGVRKMLKRRLDSQ